jgi:hypothetical protein
MTVFAEKTLNKDALCLIQTGFLLTCKQIVVIRPGVAASV